MAGYLPGDDTTFVRAHADGQELVAHQTVTLESDDSRTVTVDLADGQDRALPSYTLDGGETVRVYTQSGAGEVSLDYDGPVLNNENPDTVTVTDGDGDVVDSEN